MRGPGIGILLITHYQRLLNYIIPDYVHVMHQGRIVRSGTKELALELEAKGYDWLKTDNGDAVGTFALSVAGTTSSSSDQE
jgi:Fe-S cluster assembly ATP-binding protein